MSLDLTETQKNKPGMFWIPGEEGKRFRGVLRLKAGKSAILETSAFHDENTNHAHADDPDASNGKSVRLSGKSMFQAMDIPSRKLIHGIDQHGKPLTLINCYASCTGSTMAMASHRYSCQFAIFGLHLQHDDLHCHGIRLHLDHLDDWFGRRLFQHQSEVEETDSGGAKITKIAIPVPQDLTTPLYLPGYSKSEFFSSWTMSPGDTEFKLTSRSYLDLYFAEPKEWDGVLHEVHRWQWLLSLATRRPVDVREFALFRSDVRHTHEESGMDPCYVWMKRKHSRKAPDYKRRGYDFHFTYKDVTANLPELIGKWHGIQKPWAAVLHRFFAISHRRGLWLNEEFLFLAQAVESLHRARTGDTDTKGVVERAAKNAYLNSPEELRQLLGDRGLFVRQFRKTRNYWSHYGEPTPESDPEVLGDLDLYDFNQKLRWIVEYAILRELGVPDICASKVWSPQWRGHLVTFE
jgi:hypothetical protein